MTDLSATPFAEPILETLANVEAFEKTPLYTQFPHTNSYDLFQESAQRFGDTPAIEFLLTGQRDEKSRTTSFRELARQITQTANLLHSLGVQQTDAVAILLPTLPQSHPAIWGSQATGISSPINPMLDADHIAEIIDAAHAKVVICLAPSTHSDLWQKLQKIIPRLTTVHTVLVVHQAGLTLTDSSLPEAGSIRYLDFNSAAATQPRDKLLSGRSFTGDQVAAYFHTGGTTGRPKIACLTHGNMAFLGQLMQVYTAHLPLHTILCGLPLFHIYGVIIQGVSAFSVGYRVVLLTPAGFRSPEGMKNFWHHIERFEVRGFSGVPTVLMALNQIPVGDADISCLTSINSGAAPLPPTFEHSFEKKFNVEVGNGYGMTETTSLISRAPAWQPPGSVGMRLPYSQIRIVHLDDDKISRDCELEENGVILVKGPQVFKGYKTDSDNATAWVEDGWFNTGDLGCMDKDGYLYLAGRAKDLIIRGGHNIDPVLIEDKLATHPCIASVVALGQPDAYAGELPMAYVTLNSGADCTQEELLKFCEQQISERAAVPKRIEILSTMPLTAVGKIYRPMLRQQITETVLKEVLSAAGIDAEVSSQIHQQRGLLISVKTKGEAQRQQAKDALEPFALTIEIV